MLYPKVDNLAARCLRNAIMDCQTRSAFVPLPQVLLLLVGRLTVARVGFSTQINSKREKPDRDIVQVKLNDEPERKQLGGGDIGDSRLKPEIWKGRFEIERKPRFENVNRPSQTGFHFADKNALCDK